MHRMVESPYWRPMNWVATLLAVHRLQGLRPLRALGRLRLLAVLAGAPLRSSTSPSGRPLSRAGKPFNPVSHLADISEVFD